jgi:DUF4097 and DUF4098 domain-containing protein YvlB
MNLMHRTMVTAVAVMGLGAQAAAQSPAAETGQEIERAAQQLARAGQQAPRQAGPQQRREQEAERRRQAAERARERAERNWAEATEPFSRMVPLGPGGTVDLQNIAGDIVVTGGGGSDVRIEAIRRARHPMDAEARRLLEEVRIEVLERGGSVEIRTQHPRLRNAAASVDYTVAIPDEANVILRTVSGNVRVTNVSGELRAESLSGNVTASSVRRVRALKSVSGNLEIADGEADELTATTLSGDVTVRNLRGRALDINTVSGHLRLTGVELDRVRLESASGDLDYTGRLARGGRYEFQSLSGSIRLTPEGNAGFDVQANTFSGDFRSDYTLTPSQETGAGARGRVLRRVRGTFGDAGASITARTFDGDIVIVRR